MTGTYLLLLVSQLSGIFFQGMLTGANGGFDPLSAWTALGVFFLVLLLSAVGKGWWKSYAMLIGMLAGWILFSAFGRASGAESSAGSPLPTVLEWGPPRIGMESAITGILVAFVLLSNMVASLAAVGEAVRGRSDVDIRELTRGGWVSGINHGLSALFSTGGMVPLSVSAGFVRLTGEEGKGPLPDRLSAHDRGFPGSALDGGAGLHSGSRRLCRPLGLLCPDGGHRGEDGDGTTPGRAEGDDFWHQPGVGNRDDVSPHPVL